ncbi:MAG: hypothetical protein ACRCTA_02095, partial [Bacilli bacterium]
MNKDEYLKRLITSLRKYETKGIYEIMADYEQIIDEILIDNNDDFNEVINKLGYPEILAEEIAIEFNFTIKEDFKQQYKRPQSDNRYGLKRQRSNIVWNLLLGVYYFVSVTLMMALASLIILTIYFTPQTTIGFITEDNQYKIEICQNNL